MSRDLGRDVPGSEELYARKLWADFSFPITTGETEDPCVKPQRKGHIPGSVSEVSQKGF